MMASDTLIRGNGAGLSLQGEAQTAMNHPYVPTGDVTIFEAASFKDELVKLLALEGPVAIDCSNVGRVDSCALQLIIAAQRSGRLALTGVSDALRQKLVRIGCADAPMA